MIKNGEFSKCEFESNRLNSIARILSFGIIRRARVENEFSGKLISKGNHNDSDEETCYQDRKERKSWLLKESKKLGKSNEFEARRGRARKAARWRFKS